MLIGESRKRSINRRWKTLMKRGLSDFNKEVISLSALQRILSRVPNRVCKRGKISRLLSISFKVQNERLKVKVN